MVWAGAPFAQKIEFHTGAPIGVVSYSLLGNDGTEILTETITPATGALSVLIVIDGDDNTCDNPYFENRTVTWYYTTADGIVADRTGYRVDRPLPITVSPEGVRTKIGIEAHELGDELIDLVTAYADFVELVGEDAIEDVATTGDRAALLCVHAVEAMAGLFVIRSLQLRAVQSETSGTNEYQRFSKIDWRAIEDDLLTHVARGRAALDPNFDATGAGAFTFGTAPRSTDAITGA